MFAAKNAFMQATRASNKRFFSSAAKEVHVAVLGASGGIGQPLSLLSKLDPNVDKLSLFDVMNCAGVGADLSHINTNAKLVATASDPNHIGDVLTGANIVVIPAGVPRKPGMTRDDVFGVNAKIVKSLAEACGKFCPEAMFCIISNPVNSTVPIFAETLKGMGVYNKKHLFGVTTLDVTRARTFVSAMQGLDVNATNVTVVGGHAGTTILPLLSQVPGCSWNDEEALRKIIHRIQFGGDEVVEAKAGAGSATLSMAYAGAEFVSSVAKALKGQKGITECTFVENDLTDAPFFATPVTLGVDGVEEVHQFGQLSSIEKENLDTMLPDLIKQAEKGYNFVKQG